MKKPLIALTPSHDTASNDIRMLPTYINALEAAGAVPVVLPLPLPSEDLKQLVDTFDGFVFSGGPDVHPFLFGEETHIHCGNVSVMRDQMELALLPAVMEARKPILGVCRGVQLLNIGLGGTIWQDIPSQVERDFPVCHTQTYDYTLPSHHVTVVPGSLLGEITGEETLSVNSIHHQAVKDVADGLTVAAVSSDGLTEALEMPGYPFFLAVQWHPEYLYQKNEASAKLFRSFVNACR